MRTADGFDDVIRWQMKWHDLRGKTAKQLIHRRPSVQCSNPIDKVNAGI